MTSILFRQFGLTFKVDSGDTFSNPEIEESIFTRIKFSGSDTTRRDRQPTLSK